MIYQAEWTGDKVHELSRNFYILECYIHYDYTKGNVVYFLSNKQGDEFGQFESLEQAKTVFNNLIKNMGIK